MKRKHYSLIVCSLPLLCLGVISLFNFYIDPYQIFSENRDAVYRDKPALHANMRMHKAHQVSLQKPNALILGTSKAIQGIPTQHSFFNDKRVYNLAVPLATMNALTYLLRHAQDNHPLSSVVLALDFLSFNTRARTDGPAAGFQTSRLDGHEESSKYYWQDYLSALTSMDALRASFRNNEGHRVLTGLGGREDAEIRSRLKDGGHRSNTIKIEEFFTNAVYLPKPHRKFSFTTPKESSLFWYEQFMRSVYQNDIPTQLLISPNHARLNELIYQAGLWPQFEQWKRRLVAINELVAKEFDKEILTLWDFSMPGTITTEAFPEAGDELSQMKYYYEAIHFNQTTGSLILDRLAKRSSIDKTDTTEPFGIELDANSIDQTLATINERQSDFRKRYSDYVIELRQMIDGNQE
ncbi:MAG: hypothetical protein AB8B79_02545 [Granulosicoccus sp.]